MNFLKIVNEHMMSACVGNDWKVDYSKEQIIIPHGTLGVFVFVSQDKPIITNEYIQLNNNDKHRKIYIKPKHKVIKLTGTITIPKKISLWIGNNGLNEFYKWMHGKKFNKELLWGGNTDPWIKCLTKVMRV
jgi:hypothetical protein